MAGKDIRRKPKRRTSKPTLDPELETLASVISEYQLDNNAYGWFRAPWYDGTNAAGLCFAAEDVNYDHYPDQRADDARQLIRAFIAGQHVPPTENIYEKAGNLAHGFIASKVNTNTAKLLAAGLRCIQLKIANSHGGGAVYNEILIPAFLPIEPAKVEAFVLEWRCRDSIGTTHFLKGDHNDRQRQAFTIAWRRGLYLAAYSLPPTF